MSYTPSYVYVVYGAYEGDYSGGGCGNPIGCFTTRDLAETFILKICECQKWQTPDNYDIEELDLDDMDMTRFKNEVHYQ